MAEPVADEVDAEAGRLHREKKARIKQAKDRLYASKTVEKGLLMVHTGNGKGKTTAGLGLILRMLGHGQPVALVKFVKATRQSGEHAVLERFSDLLSFHAIGDGFTWNTQDLARDIATARAGWGKALELMADPRYRLVVLDELNIVLRYGYLPVEEVVAALAARRAGLHVLVTGRTAPPALVEAADMVTEMTLVKHHFRAGVKAQEGIEF